LVFGFSYSNRFGARRVQIYSPYVIINQTGVPLEFKVSNSLTGQDQSVAGQASKMVIGGLIDTPFLTTNPSLSV
jgi:hypothetical protein